MVIWLLGYISVYSLIAGTTTIMAALGYTLSEAGVVSAVSVVGGLACAFIAYFWGERLERKYWLLIAALIALAGGCIFALGGKDNLVTLFLGMNICSLGTYLWLPVLYTWSTENYPTRARASGFALVDGIGHVGGGIGMSYVVLLVARLGPFLTFLMLGIFLLTAAQLAFFGTPTRKKRLDEVSP
jgi:MFS family permease